MSSTTICIMITIFVYLVGMLLIGFHYAKKNESSSDFYLGGRKLGPLVTAMSAEASDMSSYLLMGLPGLAYLSGLADVGWTAIGLAVGTYLNWLFTAKRLRRYTHITGSFTPVSYTHLSNGLLPPAGGQSIHRPPGTAGKSRQPAPSQTGRPPGGAPYSRRRDDMPAAAATHC